MDLATSLIRRAIPGYIFPDDEGITDSEYKKAVRCKAFSESSLVLWPHAVCDKCQNCSSLADFPNGVSYSQDPEKHQVNCPSCDNPCNMMISVSSMYAKEPPGPYSAIVLQRQFDETSAEELKLDAFEPGEHLDTVTRLGEAQQLLRFAIMALSTPLGQLTAIELIKQQPTLAYNMLVDGNLNTRMAYFRGKMMDIISSVESVRLAETSVTRETTLRVQMHMPEEIEDDLCSLLNNLSVEPKDELLPDSLP